MDDLDLLKQVPLFSQMDDAELAGIRALMTRETFQRGQVIIREGDTGDDLYVVVQGSAQTSVSDLSGADVVVDEVGPGGFFGELSMLTEEPRSARVQATADIVTLALGRAEFFDFLQRHPPAALDVLKVLGQRVSRTAKLLRGTVSRNVNVVDDAQMTLGERIADQAAALIGSWRFIIVQSSILAIWIVLNVTAWINHWDPYPFILLNLALSFQAAYSGPVIMMSQNRQSDKDRLAAEIDHQVNAKAELEIGLLRNRLDDLEQQIHRNHKEMLLALEHRSAT
jgi:uncharacterized membrane protein